MCISTSPSTDRRSDPSGETTINGVPSFLWHTHRRHLPHKKMSGLGKKTGIIFPTIVATTLISFALKYFIPSFGGVSFGHSQMCDPTRRKRVAHTISFSKKHFVHFSEHIFCSIHQLTCSDHVQRITATV